MMEPGTIDSVTVKGMSFEKSVPVPGYKEIIIFDMSSYNTGAVNDVMREFCLFGASLAWWD
ncbi:MAG: hypothetical protein ACLR6J_06535 [Parabacteroides merdae]